jgi:Zn-dependent protease with chaperone function
MDFFSRQEQSRRATRRLVMLFGLAFFAVAVITAVAATAAVGMYTEYDPMTFGARTWQQWAVDNAALIGTIVVVTMGLMVLASLYRAATIARGGGQVARLLGGTAIHGDDPDPLHQRLVNVVEEMAIASGLPVPEIFVLEREAGINAFAAGLTHTDAAVAVTRGSLERLNRAELQGVIAHEFSHILNGDMRLNQRLIGFSFGILVLWLMGRWLLRSMRFARLARGSRNKGAGAVVLIGIALSLIGGIGVFFSRLIKAAVARHRERLADASAVQFTRDPSGLAGALKKIGGFTAHLSSVETEEVAHMLFGRGGPSYRGFFATHPPLVDRIRALEPSFDPRDFPSSAEPLPPPVEISAVAAAKLAPDEAVAPPQLDASGSVGKPELGAAMRSAIPEELYHAAHSQESSILLVLALALSTDEATRRRQEPLLEKKLGHERAARAARLRAELGYLDRRLWLPLLELAAPALKARPAEQLEFLFELVEALASIDQQVDVFEFVMLRMLTSYSGADARRRRAPTMGVEAALATVVATTAAFGHADAASARSACDAGLAAIGMQTTPALTATIDRCVAARSVTVLDDALLTLARLKEGSRRRVLIALLATVRHDRNVEIVEAELFRAVAAVLGCPMPPAAAIR